MKITVPYEETPLDMVEAMLDMAGVGPSDTLIDLGCGDGRVVVAAVRRGARAIGIDHDPKRIETCRSLPGEYRLGEIEDTDLREADVIFMFHYPSGMMQEEAWIRTASSPGTRIVSYQFTFPNWWPVKAIDGGKAFLWKT